MNCEKTELEKLLDELKEKILSAERRAESAEERLARAHENANHWYTEHQKDHWRVKELEKGIAQPCAGKPQRKRRISIKLDPRGDTLGRHSGKIFFYSSYSLAESLKEFGHVTDEAGYHVLTVDGRYDYDDVLTYVKSL